MGINNLLNIDQLIPKLGWSVKYGQHDTVFCDGLLHSLSLASFEMSQMAKMPTPLISKLIFKSS